MPRFMAVHSLGTGVVTREMVEASAAGSRGEAEIASYLSFINMGEGRAVCLIEAPSRLWLEDYFARIGLPYDFVSEVEVEIVGGEVKGCGEVALHGGGAGI